MTIATSCLLQLGWTARLLASPDVRLDGSANRIALQRGVHGGRTVGNQLTYGADMLLYV